MLLWQWLQEMRSNGGYRLLREDQEALLNRRIMGSLTRLLFAADSNFVRVWTTRLAIYLLPVTLIQDSEAGAEASSSF